MDQSITRRKVASEVMAQARAPALEVVNSDALASLIFHEAETAHDLEPHVRDALRQTAAALAGHSRDGAHAADATKRLIDGMRRPSCATDE